MSQMAEMNRELP